MPANVYGASSDHSQLHMVCHKYHSYALIY